MFPLRDVNTSFRPHPVTFSLIALNVMAWVIQLGWQSNGTFQEGVNAWGCTAANLLSNPDAYQICTIFTSLFLHGGWMHLIGNMWFLYIFGDNVEDHLGHLPYLLFYIFCGVVAQLSEVFVSPHTTLPSIGASGAIAGILGAYIVLHPNAKVVALNPIWIIMWHKPFVEWPSWIYLGLWFLMQAMSGGETLLYPQPDAGGVAWWAHIGGFVAGLTAAALPGQEKVPTDLQGMDEPQRKAFSGLVNTCAVVLAITIGGIGYAAWQYDPPIQAKVPEAQKSYELVVSKVVPSPSLSRQFQRTSGWTGGDGAYSIPLSKTKTLWLFGDSWIGNIKNGKRQNAVMINNAAAWETLDDPKVPMQFFWRTQKGKAASLIPCPVKGHYYWPMDGIVANEKLYFFVRRVHTVPKQTGPFAFAVDGVELLKISNPDDPPPKWKITHVVLPPAIAKLELGAACLTDQVNYLYAYGSNPKTDKHGTVHNLCVARIPLDFIDQPHTWEYFTAVGWSNTPKNVYTILPNVAAELTVKEVPGVKGYVATWMDFATRKIMMSQAQSPAGQWSKPVGVYACCEPGEQLVYSAKHHPELTAGDGEMAITYCRNVQTLKEHMSKPSVYAPVGFVIQLKQAN